MQSLRAIGVRAELGGWWVVVLDGGKASAGSLQIGGGARVVVAVRAHDAMPIALRKSEVLFYLNGRCIYLVAHTVRMMGSGKSTIAKILAEVLGYSFFDSDKLVKQAVGMPSVAQIFKVHSEAFFRDRSTVCSLLNSERAHGHWHVGARRGLPGVGGRPAGKLAQAIVGLGTHARSNEASV
ncbi:hypothetical protein ABZP36_001438, partial [Zizania latifolia]